VAENACVFVDVAGFRPGKGQETLLRLFAALPREQPWQLWLVGDGPRRRRCEELARQLSVESRVRFWGHHKQPRPFYAGADCAVHASRYESMPNFLVEAQIAGLPVVAMRAGGVGETFVPGASGFLLEPGDLAGFADSVQLLLNDGQLRRRMGETGAANARELFDPEANIRAYLELFERLGGGPASA
jgi:glycosyltransferase involved in cell wall biosynthesis